MAIQLTPRERRARLKKRHKRAKKAVKLESSSYEDDKLLAVKYWKYIEQLDREIKEGWQHEAR